MTTMGPRLRKFALTAHLTVSVGWIGAVAAYLALVLAAWTSRDAQTVRAAWVGMEVIGWYVLVPLAVASLLTGVVMALGTPWGLFRHYWIVFSLLLTLIATSVLVAHMPTVSAFAGDVTAATSASRAGLPGELLHAGGGLLVLVVVAGLNVYKPRGRTPYGRHKQREMQAESQP